MARRAAQRTPAALLLGLCRVPLARARRWLRVLLLTLSVAGLTPLAELVEQVLVDIDTAEVAAAPCEEGCDEGCDDAGCHGGMHHCGCCASMPRIAPTAAWSPSGLRATLERPQPLVLFGPPDRAPPPPWQPPRA